MTVRRIIRTTAVASAVLLSWPLASAAQPDGRRAVSNASITAQPAPFADLPTISYVSFESPNLQGPEHPLTISGQLRVPTSQPSTGRLPAAVVLHGSAGIDSRGAWYVEALNDAGIATLEIDMWSARGLAGGINRPALPTLTVPDAFSALHYLAAHPRIDPQRIGVIGFSWGGVVSLLAANQSYTDLYGDGLSFAAHVAHYPVCWAYNVGIPGMVFQDLTDQPVLIQVGSEDDYDEGGERCQALAASHPNVSVNVYPNAYHGWDRLQPAITVVDPFSHVGQGGEVEIVPNPGKARQSRQRVVDFFQSALG